MDRLEHLIRFYSTLSEVEQNIGGARRLSECNGRMAWPERGVYFFRESGENRAETGTGLRVVRVGTHALKRGARTTIWTRLSQHRGPLRTGGGNQRTSIFRSLVGDALIERDRKDYPTWNKGITASAEVRAAEHPLECEVSDTICAMPFMWFAIEDEAGPESARGYIERNSIALLSNYNKAKIDPPSKTWLGHRSNVELVRESGLWNQNHVAEAYDPAFLDRLEELVSMTERAA